jgi:sugar lactone lactonase YvrE
VALAGALAVLLSCGSGSSTSGSSTITPPATGNTSPTGTIIVADTLGNRVLLFRSPINTGESASVVLGQSDFTSSLATTSANGFDQPVSAVKDAQGNLWVTDWNNNRILEFKPPFTNGMNASVVIGQPNFTSNTRSQGPDGFALPRGLAFDKFGNLWVADDYNSRVLEFTPPFTVGMSASLILGKTPGFGTGTCSSPNRGLCSPTAISFDSAGNLWVVDNGNNRVLEYNPPFAAGESPALVLGQTDFNSNAYGPAAASLNYPWGIVFDSAGNLWISDALNWRVLEYKPPFSNGQAASLVLGLPDFTSTSPADLQISLSNPREIAFDSSGNLYVVDVRFRVVMFSPPFSNGMRAAKVLGQPDFTSTGRTVTASGLFGAVGVSTSN